MEMQTLGTCLAASAVAPSRKAIQSEDAYYAAYSVSNRADLPKLPKTILAGILMVVVGLLFR